MKSFIAKHQNFFIELLKRDIKNRYNQSVIGFFWLFINPILLLLIYYFVFQQVFKIKLNLTPGQDFISFIAVGLWPWVAFSEAISSATNSIAKHIDLIKKITLPKWLLVLLEILAPFIIHGMGMIFIVIVLRFGFSQPVAISQMPLTCIVMILLAIFSLGVGLLLASLQVFLKDISQLLPPVLMIWFYLTPIIYPAHQIPKAVKSILALNPVSPFINSIRSLLLDNVIPPWSVWLQMCIICTIMLLIGFAVFRRLEPRFEDMY